MSTAQLAMLAMQSNGSTGRRLSIEKVLRKGGHLAIWLYPWSDCANKAQLVRTLPPVTPLSLDAASAILPHNTVTEADGRV
jgi:hypothetical protein